MKAPKRVAVVFGAKAGIGGLGQHTASAIRGIATTGCEVHAIGPGYENLWPLSPLPANITWHTSPRGIPRWRSRYTHLRWHTGLLQLNNDRIKGRWAARQLASIRPDLCYVFTQVGLEVLRWCKAAGVPSILENPNGHIRNYRNVYDTESVKWGGGTYHGHPTLAMVDRIEEEYRLADKIRVSSRWAHDSMRDNGVDSDKISVLDQPIDLNRFCLPPTRIPGEGPLHVCFVGSLDLRKGFVYLLRAVRLIGTNRVALEFVGATGDRASKALLTRESVGLQMTSKPGDPVPAYHKAELAVVPSLEDGLPFVTGEAMASGLPVVISRSCGSAAWIVPEATGWTVEPASAEEIASALELAMRNRDRLPSMGLEARRTMERLAEKHAMQTFADWVMNG
jgi:glycosyltransferase involved in cell wall biosynthesis